jgi:hypothetical protein
MAIGDKTIIAPKSYVNTTRDALIEKIDRNISTVASNVLLSGNLDIANQVITKNHAVVTYVGNGGDEHEISTGTGASVPGAITSLSKTGDTDDYAVSVEVTVQENTKYTFGSVDVQGAGSSKYEVLNASDSDSVICTNTHTFTTPAGCTSIKIKITLTADDSSRIVTFKGLFIPKGISSIDFTQPNNGSGYYNKRVGKGFAVIADGAVDLIDSTNDTSDAANWTAGNDANITSDGTTLSVNADTTNYPYAQQIISLTAGVYAFSVIGSGVAPVLYIFDNSDGSTIAGQTTASVLTILNLTSDTDIKVQLVMNGTGDDDTATFSNLSILPLEISGSCVANTSKVHIKSRSEGSGTYDGQNHYYDGLRGYGQKIHTNLTNAEEKTEDGLTSFNNNGITLGTRNQINYDGDNFVLYQTLYTHIKWGLTSHNKFSIEAYNPVTREGMIMYEGSGDYGHEISHSMGVELDYTDTKNLTTSVDWFSNNNAKNSYLFLNTDSVVASHTGGSVVSDNSKITLEDIWGHYNDTDTYIMYYKCKSETFTIGTYIGTGASGNKIETRDVYGNPVKLRDVVIKRIDATGDWYLWDTDRGEQGLKLNLSDSEGLYNIIVEYGNFAPDYDRNTLNGQYLYFGYVDTNATTTPDDSYFNLPTDDSNLNITSGVFSFTEGIDELGFIKNTQQVTETIDFTGVQDGLYWVGRQQDGAYRFEKNKPSLGLYEKQFADDNRLVFDSESGKLFETIGGELVTNGDFSDGTTGGWSQVAGSTTFEVSNGQLLLSGTSDADAYVRIVCTPHSIYNFKFDCSTDDVTIRIGNAGRNTDIFVVNVTSDREIIFETKDYTDVFITFITRSDGDHYFDNISVFKIIPDLGSELPPISFLENPIIVASETPMSIRLDDKLLKNTMESLEVHKELEVKGKATVNDLEIVDRPMFFAGRTAGNIETDIIIDFNDIQVDTHNAYKGGVWQCPKDGVYIVDASARAQTATTGDVGVDLIVGSLKTTASSYKSGDNERLSFSMSISSYLHKGDLIYVQSWGCDSDDCIYGHLTHYTNLSISYLGA